MSAAGLAFRGGFALMRVRFAAYGTLALALSAVAFLAVPPEGGAPLTLARALAGLGLVALAFGLPASIGHADGDLHAALPRTVLGAAVLLAAGLAADLGPAAFVLPAVVVAALFGRSTLLWLADGRRFARGALRLSDVAFSGVLLLAGMAAAAAFELVHRGSIAVVAPLLMLGVAYAECMRVALTQPRLRARGEAAPAG